MHTLFINSGYSWCKDLRNFSFVSLACIGAKLLPSLSFVLHIMSFTGFYTKDEPLIELNTFHKREYVYQELHHYRDIVEILRSSLFLKFYIFVTRLQSEYTLFLSFTSG